MSLLKPADIAAALEPLGVSVRHGVLKNNMHRVLVTATLPDGSHVDDVMALYPCGGLYGARDFIDIVEDRVWGR